MNNHNAARWLVVRWLPQAGGPRIVPRRAGWYVVRTCRCHWGHPVTVPLASEAHAERARQAMLVASQRLGT